MSKNEIGSVWFIEDKEPSDIDELTAAETYTLWALMALIAGLSGACMLTGAWYWLARARDYFMPLLTQLFN